MGSAASTPVYAHKIDAPRPYRGKVVPPFQPSYKTNYEDVMAVANSERIFQRSPRFLPVKHGYGMETWPSQMPSRRSSTVTTAIPTPRKSKSDYVLIKEKDLENSGFDIRDNGQYIVKNSPNYSQDKSKDDVYILSQYDLQSDGKYRLKESREYLLRRNSDINFASNSHPFAPTTYDDSRKSNSSGEMTNYKNAPNFNRYENQSSSEVSSTSSRLPSSTQKFQTGVMLDQVVKALEATPPQFLRVPEDNTHHIISPTPPLMTSVATNTMPAPPNTGYRQRTQPKKSKRNPISAERKTELNHPTRQRLVHHNSSPELFRTRVKSVFSDSSRSPSPTRRLSRSESQAVPNRQYLSPPYNRRHNSSPAPSGGTLSSKTDASNHLIPPRRGSYRRSSPSPVGQDEGRSPRHSDRPQHLTPSRVPEMLYSNMNKERRKSSTLSIASGHSSVISIPRSPGKSPLKINNHGLVYI